MDQIAVVTKLLNGRVERVWKKPCVIMIIDYDRNGSRFSNVFG